MRRRINTTEQMGNGQSTRGVPESLLVRSSEMVRASSEIRGEMGGHIDEDGVLHVDTPARPGFSVPPTTVPCAAAWHTHPYARVLVLPEDDVPFHPPSAADVYYAVFGKAFKLYDRYAVCAPEGVYLLSVTNDAVCRAVLAIGAHDPDDLAGTGDNMPFDAASVARMELDPLDAMGFMLRHRSSDIRALGWLLAEYEIGMQHATRSAMTTEEAASETCALLATHGVTMLLVDTAR